MGAYLYTVRRSDPIIAQLGDRFVDIYRMRYLRKPWIDGVSYDKISRLQIGRAYHAWEKDNLTGMYVVMCGKELAAGDRVYRMQGHRPVWSDGGDRGPGEFVGVLEGEPLRWRITPMGDEGLRRYETRRDAEQIRAGRMKVSIDGAVTTVPEAAERYLELYG